MKALIFFGKCILAFILLSLIFWTIVLGVLQTKQGQTWGFNLLITYLEHTTQTEIQVGKMNFSFPLKLHLEDISISQNQQPLLTIQDLELNCAYSKLFQGRLVFSKLNVTDVDVKQLLQSSTLQIQESSRSWGDLLLPFYVKLENIHIQNVHLSPTIIDTLALPSAISQVMKQSALDIQGLISNNPFRKSLTAHLLLTNKSENVELPLLRLGIDSENYQLSFSFHCHSFPLQVLKPTLPSDLKAHLALYASAPILTWQHFSRGSLQEERAIEGYFKFFVHASGEDPSFLSTLIGQQTSLRGRYLLNSLSAIEFFNIKIKNPHLSLHGDAILTSEFEIKEGSFKGEIKDLEPFQPWIGHEIKGKIAFEGESTGLLLSPSLRLHLESSELLYTHHLFQKVSANLQAQPKNQNWSGFLTLSFDHQKTPWKIDTAFKWNEQKRLTLYQLQANVMHSYIEGEVTCSAPDYLFEGFLESKSENLMDVSSFFDLSISGKGQLSLELATLTSTNQQKLQGIKAQFHGKELRWKEYQAEQLNVNLQVDPLQQETDFIQLHAEVTGEQIHWQEYAIQKGSAQIKTQLNLSPLDLRHLSTEWQAQGMQWPKGKIAQANGQVHLQNPLENIEGSFQIALHEMQTETLQLEELTASSALHSDQTQWPFQLAARGVWQENFNLAMEGGWHYQTDSWQIQANRLSGQLGPYPLQLMQPLHFVQRPQARQLAGLHLQWGEAELQVDFNQVHDHISTQFKTNAIPSELFHFVAPQLPLTGRATFKGHLEGPIQNPQGQLQIDLHRVQITEDIFAQKPFIAGRMDLYLNEKGIQVKSELNGIGQTPLQIAGNLPIRFSLEPFSYKIESKLPFQLALHAEGDLDPYLHLFYNDTTNLSGHAKIALHLSGQMTSPQIQGHIDLLNGTYESLSTGALYHNIHGHLEGEGSKIVLTQFSAQDHKNGIITAKGTVELAAQKHFPFDFQIQSSHIFIMDSDYATISASGPLRLIGNTTQSKLQGVLTIDQATIHLEEALPGQIKTVDVRHINLSKEEHAAYLLKKKEKQATLEFDVKLEAPRTVKIEGKNLKSEWLGTIAVTGDPDHLNLHGELRVVQGEYNFNGKKFNLSQGTIHFAGSPAKKTTLYVVASKEIDRIRAEIIVKGPTTKPVISFRSNPPLSQREILSYILFNRGISNISPDQGEQLSQSFISLNSSEQTEASNGLLSRLRNNMGIDRLDFITSQVNKDPTRPDYNVHDNESKSIGVEVGKTINENIQFSVKQSMTSLNPIIAVEIKLHKNIKAQAEGGVNKDIPFLTSIKWKKDY